MSNLYEKFHGTPPKTVKRVKVATPKEGEKLVAIGRLIELTYEPFGSSKRKGVHYVHEMGDEGEGKRSSGETILAVSQDGQNFYLIKSNGSRTRFSERGILG